ncbi:MAG: NYN domain-containing protein [Sulfobacillus sp.]
MAVTLTQQQRVKFAAALAEQEAAVDQLKVSLVADSPNLTRCATDVYGKFARPDLPAVLRLAKQYGSIHEARMIANPGLPHWVAQQWEQIGFDVDFLGRAPDCDDRAIRQCVQSAMDADVLFIMSGDHAFVDVIRLIRMSQKKVVVVAVRSMTAACLIEACDQFIELPVTLRSQAA